MQHLRPCLNCGATLASALALDTRRFACGRCLAVSRYSDGTHALDATGAAVLRAARDPRRELFEARPWLRAHPALRAALAEPLLDADRVVLTHDASVRARWPARGRNVL